MLNANTVLQPQFMQQLLGYNATTAGLALTAGGIALVIVMPLAGFATGKISARTLAVAGFIMFIVTFRYAAYVTNLQMSFAQASWLRVVQMLPLPFCFISITNAAYVGMPKEESNQVVWPHQFRTQSRRQHHDRDHQRSGHKPRHVAPAALAERHAIRLQRVHATSAGAFRLLQRKRWRRKQCWHGLASIYNQLNPRPRCRAIRTSTWSSRGCPSA